MKRIAFLLLMMITSVISFADNVFYGDDVTIAPGETATVTLCFDNTDPVHTFAFLIVLPEWLQLVEDSEQFVESRTDDEELDDMEVTLKWRDATKDIMFSYMQSSYKKYKIIGSGKFLTFEVKASADVENGTTGQITFDTSDAEMYKGKTMDDVEFSCTPINVTVGAASAETVKVTLTKQYNTYVPAKALDFSSVEGLTAYYVTAVTATEATITETTTVAAGEGIILKGTAGTEYEVPVATTEVAKSTTNKLATGTVAEGDYILFDGKFVPCTGGTLPDGKAYLPKAAISTSSAKALILGFGDATGINEAKAAKADGAIYSISGVRVAQPQKGVYIMNGRKVIVK